MKNRKYGIYLAAALVLIVLFAGMFAWERLSVGTGNEGAAKEPNPTVSVESPDTVQALKPETLPVSEERSKSKSKEPSAAEFSEQLKNVEAEESGSAHGSTSEPSAAHDNSGVSGAESAANQNTDVPEEPSFAAGVVPDVPEEELHAVLSVSCASLVGNASLDPEKAELVPSDGVLFAAAEVVFYPGETVFNLLAREMRKNGIHMEFASFTAYKTAYVEGIGNLYEFDAGELSGWMYRVNGVFPNKGCSAYALSDGDVVEWLYTCDLGKDIGASETAMEEQKGDE